MEPKPLITYYGDMELLSAVLQKKLQKQLKLLQFSTPPKEDTAFNSLCSGVTFTPLTEVTPSPLYTSPALHTYWTSCIDEKKYRSYGQQEVGEWLDRCQGSEAKCLVVYVVTPEVRTRRKGTLTSKPVEERLRTDFRGKADDIITLRLSDNDPTRLTESYNTFTNKLNTMCLARFKRVIDKQTSLVEMQDEKMVSPEKFYEEVFVRELDLAVLQEMTLKTHAAQKTYSKAITHLEEALSSYLTTPPSWLHKMCHAPCTSWDYPKLVWSQLSWQYLPVVREGTAPLLHVRTFFLARLTHLLFAMGKAWSVSDLVISTLHCMAREIKSLQLCFPNGAFDCWAYMTCNEAIQAFMALISPDSLQLGSSSHLLVRAELWHYALQKLQGVGSLCGVMPSANKLNHDKVLIQQITSGIHPVPSDSVPTDIPGIEDQGRKLIDILSDRHTFQNEFLRLGEMVIGAFKYAGRRRMAFKVGTTIAQFHIDLGLVDEAEQLLSDICKFYSEDQWTQLSTNAFSLLANCQQKLRMEDKYVTTMLLLASLPPYPEGAHDPNKWLSSLTSIAQRSPYQKLLNWEPLLKLCEMVVVGGVSYTTGDTVAIEMRLTYNGPKEIRNLIFGVELCSESSTHRSSTPSSPLYPHTTPAHSHTSTPAHPHTSPPRTPSLSSLANLDSLDFNNMENISGSRPIGGEGKLRAISTVTPLTSAEIAELADEEGGRGKRPDILRKMGVTLSPGENKVVVSGEVHRTGEYFPAKLSVKWGCLDFVHTLTHNIPRLSVHPFKMNLDLLLLSECGVFLEGCSHKCILKVEVGQDTTVPENALIQLDFGDGITCSDELSVTLPSMSPGESHEHHMTLAIDSKPGGNQSSNDLVTWTHEVTATCEWLNPTHLAVLPVQVFRPLTVRVCEHCAGQRSFLRLELFNSSPLPLLIRDLRLTTPLDLSPLYSDPQILYPREDYSLLWAVGEATPTLGVDNEATLILEYLPCIHDDQQLVEYRTFTHCFRVSNMQQMFELRAYLDHSNHTPLRVNTRATLTYHLKNTSQQDSLPQQLQYRINSELWKVYGCEGMLDVPPPGKTTVFTVGVAPRHSGLCPLPALGLAIEGGVPVGGAQVYNLSHSTLISVE